MNSFRPTTHDLPAATLLDLLASRPDAAGGSAVVVLPPAAPRQAPATPGGADGGAAPSARSMPAALLLPLARMVLRRPAIRQLALRLLKHSPTLYARAYRMMMASGGQSAPVDEAQPDHVASLSLRANTILRQLIALQTAPVASAGARPRLAFVSPLPPERTGVASYATELLTELMRHADIELVVAQDTVTLPPALSGLAVRSASWFAEHGAGYDQVLYQFGNSRFHSHMVALIARHPGVVVLHDFFIGGVLVQAQMSGAAPQAWREALFASHGYGAVLAAATPAGHAQAHKDWPCSLPLLEQASRVIVHSRHARQLVADWFGAAATHHIDVIPHPRTPPVTHDRAAARAALGIAPDCFLVCSFGFIAPHKLTRELLRAWTGSTLHADRACTLVLVGANHDSPYGVEVESLIRAAGATANIRIAGWTDDAVYRQYLQAADIGVQLRTNAQGESSGAVLDCMNYGLPTIVNANGSMGEFAPGAMWRLPDVFEIAELRAALEALRRDPARRQALGTQAVALLDASFRPAQCARQYLATLTQARAERARRDLAWRSALARLAPGDAVGLQRLATTLAEEESGMQRQLLIDVSDWAAPGATPDALAAQQLRELLAQAPAGLRVEPVWLDDSGAAPRYRQARNAVGRLLDMNWPAQQEPVVDVHAEDIYYAPDAAMPALGAARAAGLLAAWRARGVSINLLLRTADQVRTANAACADRLLCASDAIATAAAQVPDRL